MNSAGILLIISLLLPFGISSTESENYCEDPESWKKWNELIEKYPDDEEIQTLHALRIGLCAKIEQGTISFEMANDLFSLAYDMIINRKLARNEQELKGL